MKRIIIMILLAAASTALPVETGATPTNPPLAESVAVHSSSPIPILTLVEGVSSYSQSNPPASKTMLVLRVVLPRSSDTLSIQEYIRRGQDPAARKVFACRRSEALDSEQRVLIDCRLDALAFRVPLSAYSGGEVEVVVDGGLFGILADVFGGKFDRISFDKETLSAQQLFFGNLLEVLVFPRRD